MANLTSPSAYGAGNIKRPVLPGNFTAAHDSQTQITLTWTEAGSPKFVQIERSLTDSAYVNITTLLGGVETYVDTGLSANTTYYYRYRQKDRLKWSDYEKDSDKTDV
jgi:phosphodiesterase/alkaline phosphatase D-like protein